MTLEDYLRLDARQWPDKTAAICGGESLTYRELLDASLRQAADMGDVRGRVVAMRSSQAIGFLIHYFAIHLAGGIAAPLDADMPDDAFMQLSERLQHVTAPEGTADILYTTGTTGRQKGVMISHRTIIADAENLIAAQHYSHDLTFVISGPLGHIGSLSKIFPVIVQGATLHITSGLKDLNTFLAAMESAEGKVATFLVPAHIRMLLTMCPDRLAALGHKIDFIETGAAPISQSDMETLCRTLPASRLYNTYASTETGIIATFNYNDGECLAGCLGAPMPHSRIIITPDGLIACQGDTLMTGYAGDEQLTRSVLRDGTLFTADCGRLDDKGRLHLTGREGDTINVGGYKVDPVEVENAAMAHPSVADCICIAVPHPLTGQALKLLVVLQEGTTLDKRAMARWIAARLETHKVPLLYDTTHHVERTYNGKPNRKAYRK